MEGFQHNRQEVNDQESSAEGSELVTDPEELAELIAEAKEVRERMEEIPEEDEFGRRIVSNREDYDEIEALAESLTKMRRKIPPTIALDNDIPADFYSPIAANDNRAPLAKAG